MQRPRRFRWGIAVAAGLALVLAVSQVYRRATGEPSLRISGWKQLHPGESNIDTVLTIPGSPTALYVVTSPGGIFTSFKSTDGGENWSRIADDKSSGLALAAVDPAQPKTLYGFGQFYDDVERADGLARSDDGGATWVPATRGLPELGGLWTEIPQVVLDPEARGTLYVTLGNVFKSTSSGANWASLWKSPKETGAIRLAIDPRRPSVFYVATFRQEEVESAGLFKSSDRGRSWRRTALLGEAIFNPEISTIAIDPRKPETVYAVADRFYKSTDGGRKWKKLKLRPAGVHVSAFGLSEPPVASNSTVLAIDPSRRDTVYVSAYSVDTEESFVLKSTTGGKTWAVVARIKPKNAGEAIPFSSLAIDATGHRVYGGLEFGGLYVCETCWKVTSPANG